MDFDIALISVMLIILPHLNIFIAPLNAFFLRESSLGIFFSFLFNFVLVSVGVFVVG